MLTFPTAVNHIFSQSQQDFYCPAYRNLARHIPMEDGLCPTSSIYRKEKNCLSDRECPKQSYCCFSICNGITRCYNPYTNEWKEPVPETATKPPCPLIQVPPTTTTTTPTPPVVTQAPIKPAPVPTTEPPVEITTPVSTTPETTIAPTTTTKAPVPRPPSDDEYDTLVKTKTGDDDSKFVAEEGV